MLGEQVFAVDDEHEVQEVDFGDDLAVYGELAHIADRRIAKQGGKAWPHLLGVDVAGAFRAHNNVYIANTAHHSGQNFRSSGAVRCRHNRIIQKIGYIRATGKGVFGGAFRCCATGKAHQLGAGARHRHGSRGTGCTVIFIDLVLALFHVQFTGFFVDTDIRI